MTAVHCGNLAWKVRADTGWTLFTGVYETTVISQRYQWGEPPENSHIPGLQDRFPCLEINHVVLLCQVVLFI